MTTYNKPFVGGTLRANKFKTAPNHPDIRGDMVIDRDMLQHLNKLALAGMPIRFDMAGWKKKDRDGKDFLSLTAQPDRRDEAELANRPAQATQRQAPAPVASAPVVEDDDADLPF